MADKKQFTISIGEYGTIIALHSGKTIQNKILVATLNEENKRQLRELFDKHKSVPTYILLDTPDQNYKKKTYPFVSSSDFNKIVKRDFTKEFDSNEKSFQNYYGVKDKINKKWECVFVSAPHSSEIENWIEFLLATPNRLVGIYMVPIEIGHLADAVCMVAKAEHGIKTNADTILSFIVHNKISGVRQTVFFNQTIVFTRVVNYDFDDKNFSNQFERDIGRSNEYLKMIFPKLKTQDLIIINVLSDEITSKITNTEKREFNFINYSPYTIATKLGLGGMVSKNGNNFFDIVIANYFAKNHKKILKFSNPRISFSERLYLYIKSISYLNNALLFALLAVFIQFFIHKHQFNNTISKMYVERAELEKKFQSVNNAALEGEAEEKKGDNNLANEIIYFGKIDSSLSKVGVNIVDAFGQLSLIKKHGVIANSFVYKIPSYNPKAQSFTNDHFQLVVAGEISDASGDVEILFRKFDALGFETKNKLSSYNIKFSEISKNVDFSKKYYSFPFELTIENKLQNAPNAQQ